MAKKSSDCQGFIFVELLIASVVMMVMLMTSYVQITNIIEDHQRMYDYTNPEVMYSVENVRALIYNEGIINFETLYDTRVVAGDYFKEITCNDFLEENFCNSVVIENEINKMYLMNSDLLPLGRTDFDTFTTPTYTQLQDYILYLVNFIDFDPDERILIIETRNFEYSYIIY